MAYLNQRRDEIEKLCARYPVRRSALLPVLWMVQQDHGWVPQDAMKEVGEIIGVTAAEVYEVVSFYTMFHQHPVGKHHIQFCHTLACAVCGAHEAVAYIRDKYGFEHDKNISSDGKFSMEEVECIGACAEAPAMLVGETLYGNLTPRRIDEILAECN